MSQIAEMNDFQTIDLNAKNRILPSLQTTFFIVERWYRSDLDVTDFLIDLRKSLRFPLHGDAVKHFGFFGIGQNLETVVVVMFMADANDIGHARGAIVFGHCMRIENDFRSAARNDLKK